MFILAQFMFFFFNDTATTEIYTLSLHDALPISHHRHQQRARRHARLGRGAVAAQRPRALQRALHARLLARAPVRLRRDRKSTRLNSSHGYISYAVFCLKKKTGGIETFY